MSADVDRLVETVREAIGNDGLDEFEFKDALVALSTLSDLLSAVVYIDRLADRAEQAEARVKVLRGAAQRAWHELDQWVFADGTASYSVERAEQILARALAADEEGAGAKPAHPPANPSNKSP